MDSAPGSTGAGLALRLQQLREVPGDHALLRFPGTETLFSKDPQQTPGQERGLWERRPSPPAGRGPAPDGAFPRSGP